MDNSTPPNASQSFAWIVMGPYFAGWLGQVFLTGISLPPAIQLLLRGSTLRRREKTVLMSAVTLNVLVCIMTVAEIMLWSTYQKRDEDSIEAFMLPDAFWPIPAGLVAFVVQAWFAHRAWEICNRNLIFLIYITACILIGVISSFGVAIMNVMYMNGDINPGLVAFSEIWTWGAAVIDISNSVVIIWGLQKKSTGYAMPTDGLVTKIIYATMESAGLTTTFATAASVVFLATKNDITSSMSLVFIYPLPAIYTVSMVWCLTSTHLIRKDRLPSASCANCTQYSDVVAIPSSGATSETSNGKSPASYREERRLESQTDMVFLTTPLELITNGEGGKRETREEVRRIGSTQSLDGMA